MSQRGIQTILAHAIYTGDDCVPWPMCRLPNGYGLFGYQGKRHYAHRYMCELIRGPAPSDKHEVAHECGNGALGCFNPNHLFWRTKSQNRFDALRHGTGVLQHTGNRGSLSPETVAKIRSLHGKMRQKDIAEMFGVSEPRLRAIFTYKIYRADKKIKNWTPEEVGRLKAELASGTTYPELSIMLGRSEDAIKGYVYKYRIRGELRQPAASSTLP